MLAALLLTLPRMYQVRYPSSSRFVSLRGWRYHVRCWGQAEHTPLVLLHGWMDVAASWQFVVDALLESGLPRHIIAPDWRGFGLSHSEGPSPDAYVFADYLADLDALLDTLVPEGPVDLVGHSMGGNVAMLYAGVRPQRVRRLVNLEGFGMPATQAAQAPARYEQWLNELRRLRTGDMALQSYDNLDGVARRLQKTNPRLPADKAAWLAAQWSQAGADGRWRILGEPAHKVVSAQLYRADEAAAVFGRISAPTLSVTASDDSMSQWWKGRYTLADYRQRLRAVPDCQEAVVTDAGHMLHHDQPEALATVLQQFLKA